MQKKIIHFDMDCFFAAVEIRDNPKLKGKPVIVGGSPQSRGVVSTASYEARAFGVKSAMSSAQAYALCPHGIFVKSNFKAYKEASAQIRDIFSNYTDLIEPVSIDEAYLDVTENDSKFKYASQIAKQIQKDIFSKTKLTGSAGVAPNKLLAKIASDMNKPNGITVVRPEEAKAFMGPLGLRKIPGIGPAAEKKLLEQNLKICSDIWEFGLDKLEKHFGKRMANWLFERSQGIDNRHIQTSRIRKSLGTERTFSQDIYNLDKLREVIRKLSREVSESLIKKNISGRTITLKIKYADFQQITRAKSLDNLTNNYELISSQALNLLGPTPAKNKSIRLLGVTVSNFEANKANDSNNAKRPSKHQAYLNKQLSFKFFNS